MALKSPKPKASPKKGSTQRSRSRSTSGSTPRSRARREFYSDRPAKPERRELLSPVFREAREVVRARKRPGGLAAEAMHQARLQEAIRQAERSNDYESWHMPARRIAASILKEAKTRQARLFNPAKGALVWDSFHKWTAQVVRCWQQKDEFGTWEACTLRRVGNPPPGTFTPGIEVGDTYDIESNRVKVVPARALGHGWKQPKENPRKAPGKNRVGNRYTLRLR